MASSNGMTRRGVVALLAAPFLVARPARAAVPEIKFRDLYIRYGTLSDQTKALTGRTVRMRGYMAPPLKPEVDFFVLTKLPMSTCPFCETEAQWPEDIVVVYTNGPIEIVRYTDLIDVEGVLETGRHVDEETGFLSMIRLVEAGFQTV